MCQQCKRQLQGLLPVKPRAEPKARPSERQNQASICGLPMCFPSNNTLGGGGVKEREKWLRSQKLHGVFVPSGQDDLNGEEEAAEQAQAGAGMGTEKQGQEKGSVRRKKKGRPSAADGGKAVGKGKGIAGRAVKQAEEEEQSASESAEEAAESEAAEKQEAKPSRCRRGAISLPNSPQKRKSGNPLRHLHPILSCSLDRKSMCTAKGIAAALTALLLQTMFCLPWRLPTSSP